MPLNPRKLSRMNVLKRIGLRLISIVFYFLFLGFFLLIFPFHFLFLLGKNRRLHNASHFLNKLWGIVIMYPVGIYLRTVNRNSIDPKGVYVFAPNHASLLDIPICNVCIKNTFRFIGKAELNKAPLFGYMFKRLHIPVMRSSLTGSYKSFLQAKEKLSEGTSVLLFPEGALPDKTKVTLIRFKDGAFRMAVENKVPIVPMTILNADRALLDDGKWLIRPSRVTVIFHDPIDTSEMTLEDVPELKKRIREWMYNTLVENGCKRELEEPETVTA